MTVLVLWYCPGLTSPLTHNREPGRLRGHYASAHSLLAAHVHNLNDDNSDPSMGRFR